MKLVVLSVPFLFATTVFQMCGDLNKPPPPPKAIITPDPDALPQCTTDPPFGCRALCMNPPGGIPIFSDQCDLGGANTDKFRQQVDAYIAQAIADGLSDQLCVVGIMFWDITPCEIGITPEITEDGAGFTCKAPPPGCKL